MVEHVFILAGGSGTRLWPASLQSHPKQFLALDSGRSLLLSSIERALGLHPAGKVFIITLEDQVDGVVRECMKLESGKEKIVIIPEPTARNTAPAIALGVRYVMEKFGETENILVLPADHIIRPLESFREDVEKGCELADDELLVTFGIVPDKPATGYGYIEGGGECGPGRKIASFKEKPDQKTAEKFLQQGNFYWNSGIFLFSARLFWDQLTHYSPDIAVPLSKKGIIPEDVSDGNITIACRSEDIQVLYGELPSISIDYAVMERTGSAGVVPAGFEWSDIGSWDEVSRLGVAGSGETVSIESDNNYVFSDQPVALCGVEDLIVVVQNGMVMICRKGETQGVKKIVNTLKEQNRSDLL